MSSFDPFAHTGVGAASRHPIGSGGRAAPLQKACAEFESLFLQQLLKQMRATVDQSGFLDGGRAGEIYTSMHDSHMAGVLADGGGIGLAAMLLRQLEKRDSGAGAPAGDSDHPGTGKIPAAQAK